MRQCISCWESSEVIDTRFTVKASNMRRRRKCLKCGHKFTTREILDTELIRLKAADELPGNVRDAIHELNILIDGEKQ
jgi:transcriptional regulator NrdR family protein